MSLGTRHRPRTGPNKPSASATATLSRRPVEEITRQEPTHRVLHFLDKVTFLREVNLSKALLPFDCLFVVVMPTLKVRQGRSGGTNPL